MGFPGGASGKELPASVGDIHLPGLEAPLEEEMAIHCSILAWKNFMDKGAWRATVHRVTVSWTPLSNSV